MEMFIFIMMFAVGILFVISFLHAFDDKLNNLNTRLEGIQKALEEICKNSKGEK